MAQIRITLDELPRRIDDALRWLAAGDEVLLERAGEVVAQLTPTGVAPAERPPVNFEAVMERARARADQWLEIPNDFDEWAMLEREEEWLRRVAPSSADPPPPEPDDAPSAQAEA